MDLTEKIILIIQQNTEKKMEILPHTQLRKELGFDSFEMLMITNAIEEEYLIQIDPADLAGIDTVEDIVKKLREKFPEIIG